MTRSNLARVLVVASLVGLHPPAAAGAQGTSDLAGTWTLNPALSQLPREVGFDADFPLSGGAGPDSTAAGGRARRGGRTGGRPQMIRPESEADAKRVQRLTAEIRDPSARLTIVQTATEVAITDAGGRSRTFHPNGREEVIPLGDVPVVVIARWEAGQLVILYEVEEGRQIRWSYSRVESPQQLVVESQFIERGQGDKVRRVYEPGSATDTREAPGGSTAPPTPNPAGAAPAAFDQRPGAEFRGLERVGLVIEGLDSQAAACGLKQDVLEADVSRHLTAAGLQVRRNSDEDTYVYVSIMSGKLSDGLCVSRYDVFLSTHTTAALSYHETPVLVEVSLLHKGGLAGGSPADHAQSVLKGVLEYVDQCTARIRDANP